jgi:predicted RNA-binding Zn ribbon-like protein
MIERGFDFNKLYGRVVRYYLSKRHYTKEKANLIAQKVVQKELNRRTCQNSKCGHLLYDHMRNYESCLVDKCECGKFLKA